jgi:Uma2 family endonuclease
VVEVVSTNWQNDYARKSEDYALLGITEYWIVDYLGLGGRDYIGDPKQPTFSVYELDRLAKRYHKRLFRGSEPIVSTAFPGMAITLDQIIQAILS